MATSSIQVQMQRYDAFTGRHSGYWQTVTSDDTAPEFFGDDGNFASVEDAQRWINEVRRRMKSMRYFERHKWRIVETTVLSEIGV